MTRCYLLPSLVFRIRDIFVRIRIRGSILYHVLTVPDPDPVLFVSDLQDANKWIWRHLIRGAFWKIENQERFSFYKNCSFFTNFFNSVSWSSPVPLIDGHSTTSSRNISFSDRCKTLRILFFTRTVKFCPNIWILSLDQVPLIGGYCTTCQP